MVGYIVKRLSRCLLCIVEIILFLMGSCIGNTKMYQYLKDKNNYIKIYGTVEEVLYFYEDEVTLSLSGIEVSKEFPNGGKMYPEGRFVIQDDNYLRCRKNGFDRLIKPGVKIALYTASEIWYDGYCYPVVGLETADGKVLLSFEEGFDNFASDVRQLERWRKSLRTG